MEEIIERSDGAFLFGGVWITCREDLRKIKVKSFKATSSGSCKETEKRNAELSRIKTHGLRLLV